MVGSLKWSGTFLMDCFKWCKIIFLVFFSFESNWFAYFYIDLNTLLLSHWVFADIEKKYKYA